jgi:hypothetical protein
MRNVVRHSRQEAEMDKNAKATEHDPLAAEVAAILARSATQPGINEMMALLNIAAEANLVHQISAEMTPVGAATQSSNMAPVRR